MNKTKIISALLFVALVLSALTSCEKEEEGATLSRSYYEYFDTVSSVFCYSNDTQERFDTVCAEVETTLDKYHRLFDIYYEYAGINNLKTINNNAGKSPVAVDRELIDFLLFAKEIHSLTKGETNIAFGAVTRLWHDRREDALDDPAAATIPTEDELIGANAHTSICSLIIDEQASTVYLSDAQARLDVGALGKGYATERIAESLEAMGARSYVLNVGGNIRAIGSKPDGSGWLTGITNPDKSSDESFCAKVTLSDTSCVTSGNYERYYTVGGVNYHHVIDKDTLYPSTHFASVTIIIKDSALADALSTALFCMSYEDGLSLAKSVGAEVIWVYGDGKVISTAHLE